MTRCGFQEPIVSNPVYGELLWKIADMEKNAESHEVYASGKTFQQAAGKARDTLNDQLLYLKSEAYLTILPTKGRKVCYRINYERIARDFVSFYRDFATSLAEFTKDVEGVMIEHAKARLSPNKEVTATLIGVRLIVVDPAQLRRFLDMAPENKYLQREFQLLLESAPYWDGLTLDQVFSAFLHYDFEMSNDLEAQRSYEPEFLDAVLFNLIVKASRPPQYRVIEAANQTLNHLLSQSSSSSCPRAMRI